MHQEPTNKNLLVKFPVPLCYFFGKKFIFLKCCIFSDSHQILVARVLIFGWSPHCAGKCMAKLYTVYNCIVYILLEPGKVCGKNRSLNCQLISNSVIQIHSFFRYAGLALIVLVLMVGEVDGQDFFFQKQLVLIFFCSITCF